MKIKYLKLKNWLLITLGGLLGISMTGCNTSCEYGTPEACYHVKGTVTNEKGIPIEGIGVQEIKQWNDDEGQLQMIGYVDTTDADGRYSLDFEYAFPQQPISLDFHDIDGATNGNYNDTVVMVKTEGVSLQGGNGHWYDGEGTVTQNIVLTEKTNK